MDKSRQQFEVWFAPQKEEMKNNGLGMISITRMYQRQLSAWQASRESLINSLEPVGYMESKGIDYINQHGFTHINAEKSGSINTPLYRLD